MKLFKIMGVLALVALLVPLSGCIGDDEPAAAPTVSGGSEVQEGTPPEKFTFEAVDGAAAGEVTRKHRERPSGIVPLPPLQTNVDEWQFLWNVTGLQDLGQGENGDQVGEAFYTVWIGKKEGEEIKWELVSKSESPAKDGELAGKTGWKRAFGDYVGLRVSLEVKADSQVEIPLLENVAFEPKVKEEETLPLEDLDSFGAAFADAKVTTKDDKVNLTLTAFTLPKTEGSYDVFLRNPNGAHYLGTLKLDPASGGMALAVSPDANLLTKYQFFISIEDASENKDEAGGYTVLKSRFKS